MTDDISAIPHLDARPVDTTSAKNPSPHDAAVDNTQKDPDEWVTGDEPMTGAQTSYLKTLSEQLHEPEAFSSNLTKAEASKRIDALRTRRGR